jgi:hypothetical protein
MRAMPKRGAVASLGEETRRPDQRLARHAAGVEAVAAERVLLDQRDLRLHRRRDVRRHEPAEPAPMTIRL